MAVGILPMMIHPVLAHSPIVPFSLLVGRLSYRLEETEELRLLARLAACYRSHPLYGPLPLLYPSISRPTSTVLALEVHLTSLLQAKQLQHIMF